MTNKKSTPDGNTMGYTIPDTKKLLQWLESKFTKQLKPFQQKLKESVIKQLKK